MGNSEKKNATLCCHVDLTFRLSVMSLSLIFLLTMVLLTSGISVSSVSEFSEGMRSFQNEVSPDGKRKSTVQTTGAIAASIGVDNDQLFRGLIGVSAVAAIVIGLLLVAATAGSFAGPAGSKQPKAVVVVVPGLNPDVVESAMASYKASSLAGIVTSGAAYGRIAANASDTTAALVSLLTGTAIAFHNVTNSSSLNVLKSSDATTFMRYLNQASLKTALVASERFFSGSTYDSTGKCSSVGLLDAECVGLACPTDATAYCNSATRNILSNQITALMSTTISDAFSTAAPGNSLVTVVVDAFADLRREDDNSLRALSAVSLLDGVIGQIVLAVEQRSYQTQENWLVTVVGDGVHSAQQAPLFVIPVSSGSVIRASPINTASGNIVDVFPTIAKWFNLPVFPSVVGTSQGICGDGRSVSAC